MTNNWGDRLKQVRELKNMSQRAVAMEAEVPQSTINRIEKGRVNGVNSTTAIRIAKVLGISLDYLIVGTGESNVGGSVEKTSKTDPCTFAQANSWIRTLLMHDGIVTYDSKRHKDVDNSIEGESLVDRLDPQDRIAVEETIAQLQHNQRPDPIMIKMNLIWHTAWIAKIEEDDDNECVLIQLSMVSQSELQRQRFTAAVGRQ